MNSDKNVYLGRDKGIMRKRALLLRKGCSFEITSSASEDLGCRRGDFSRKHYGSVELLISSDADGAIQRAGRFRVENGSSDETSDYTPGTWRRTDVHLENPEYHTRWFFKYFLGKVHQNYVGTDADKNPFYLSVVLSDQNNQRVPQYRAILWRKMGTLKISLPYSPTKTLSVKSILSAMNMDRFEKGPREILNPEIQKDLLVLEEQEGSVNFKFGVLFAKDGQLTDDEMFSNETGSESFDKFLNLLGDNITLQGWAGYRGGLDTKNDTTGIKSIYTVYQGHELMFHVSTMLPYSKENKQQVERKRHIGNDIVTIVFQEGDDASSSFKPSMIRSHFTHIFALVRYNSQNDSYRLKIFSEESVPLFGPPLPSPSVFTDHQEFRDFLLVKLINGEKATLETPTFAQKRQRTLDMLIRSLYQDLMPDLHKVPFSPQNMLNRRSFSDVLPESPKSARKKEEARQAEFVRIGQALKLKTIVRGDAPTSLVTTGLCRKEPWESQSFCSTFPYEIVCADSWGQSLLVATDAAGVMLLDGPDPASSNAETQALPPVQVFDKTMVVKQMHVLEPQDLLITRADKGKDARVYVFRLNTLKRGLEEKQLVRSKCDSRENKLEKTKGCHLYSINTHHGSELRIVAAIRNKLLLITRKQPRSEGFSAVSAGPDSPVEEFQYIREICLCDPPVVMALVDGPTGENDNMICVAYKHQFDLINESTGDAYRLHHVDANRVNFVAAIDVYEDGEAGLLLCYNYSCYYKKVCPFNGSTPMIQSNTSDFHFSWNQMPNAIVCAFPYILAFTTDSIEIRLVVNGNLVYTAVVPELQLAASRSDIYFVSSAPVSSASNCSSRDTSSQSSPQTPTGYEMPVFPSPLGDDSIRIPYGTKLSLYMSKDAEGEAACKHMFKIPLCNLVGRSIERPLKSPLVNKVMTAPAPTMVPPTPLISATHSLSLSRMEIKEIASRTRKELLGLTEEPSGKPDSGTVKQRKMSKKNTEEEPKARALTSTNSDRLESESFDADLDVQLHCSSSSEAEPEKALLLGESPPLASAFVLSTSFEEDVLDLK
ncbi:GTPase-activating Rap/Ran-GAP domain-like protein 3 isoform X2 [Hippoglossus hippoglossus]|uniref:GTPase-activating Rap/Ran-GAP domain-like protein 3 isoform X2 n=1 Tax=Hippoglossus hippoglossus TaxID=8267 RepID=UPI00148D58A3|nr:GTPase-activating Rap/Ran-GAP domain-like protein 3 isoform X2 [Hippoglossus hippoglossus]XP_035040690.1 GTPase-activating Rap/Ran-GAP domain-like protein 3 isoform X1 [Hippoglossus stenolepis]XP_035040691.1 GTPase-activating Rap/Ran-GAP domain-like protein 3 isoform X1 [Hippoglossus stenolepis]